MVLKNGRVIAVEIKDGSKPPSKRKLSPGEEQFRDDWQANGGEWLLIQSPDGVLETRKPL
jgi:hypothetical protein